MHFRQRGKSVQLVRTEYDAATKRTKRTVLGQLSMPDLKLDAETEKKLSDEEKAEVEAYRTSSTRRSSLERDYAAAKFSETIEHVLEWYHAASAAEKENFAAQVRRPLGKLKLQVGAAGGARKKQAAGDKT